MAVNFHCYPSKICMCLFLFSSHMRRRYAYFAYMESHLWWLRLRWNGFCLFLAQVLRSWSCATLVFAQAEPPRRPWQVLTGRRLVDCSWNRTAYMSSCGLISRVVKGQQEKRTLYQEMEKSPMRVQFQGSAVGVWRAVWELTGVESCLLKHRCSQQFCCRPSHFSCCHNHRQVQRNTGVSFLCIQETEVFCTLFWGVHRR